VFVRVCRQLGLRVLDGQQVLPGGHAGSRPADEDQACSPRPAAMVDARRYDELYEVSCGPAVRGETSASALVRQGAVTTWVSEARRRGR